MTGAGWHDADPATVTAADDEVTAQHIVSHLLRANLPDPAGPTAAAALDE